MANRKTSSSKLRYWHQCVDCKKRWPADRFLYTCPACDGLLLIERDEDFLKARLGSGRALRNFFDDLRFGNRRRLYPNNSGVWLWRELVLPGFPKRAIVSLREGQTDLFEIPDWMKRELGLPNLFIKMEGQSPSESFKDRGMTVAISDALRLQQNHPEQGIAGVCCASTGDTSAAAAVFAGYVRDHLDCLVLLPHQGTARSQLFQAIAHGARIREIKHPDGFDACMRLIEQFIKQHPELVLVNSKNDMRVVGQETIGLEILQDLSWKVPEWIAVPAGNGGNLSALLSALLLARRLKLINRLPGIIVGQTAVSDTLVRWSKSGFRKYRPGPHGKTIASAMNINDPVSFPRIEKLYPEFNIRFYRSTEPRIQASWSRFLLAGANVCPQSAVALDAVLQARADRSVKAKDTVVSISTASGVKFAQTVGAVTGKPGSAPDLKIVSGTLRALEKSL
ncbi:MAG: pyridoxal-phosphate dependent enzyme [bacterium]|nr:pyridoxal-phosphate dependent enzyme [bacterium]